MKLGQFKFVEEQNKAIKKDSLNTQFNAEVGGEGAAKMNIHEHIHNTDAATQSKQHQFYFL